MIYTQFIILFLAFTFFVYKRSKLIMMFFQQEEYKNKRFFKYIFHGLKLIDKKLTLAILVGSVICLFKLKFLQIRCYILVLSVLFAFFGILQPKTSKGKKPLVMTMRVRRILGVFYFIFFATLSLFVMYQKSDWNVIPINIYLAALFFVQIIPFYIILANILLSPVENLIRKKYYTEAKQKMKEYNPTVIAITGSYGKTSTKHILAHILSSSSEILYTPGSVNTLMGISRIVREKLKKEHKYFIVEMGAYGVGSIKRLCGLTHPHYGIITSIGAAHYERFKSIDTVAKAKFELAQAVFQNNQDGFVVINNEMVPTKYTEEYTQGNYKRVKLVSIKEHKKFENFIISKEKETTKGLEFELKINGKSYKISAPIYGKHQIQNIALCFVMACSLGMKPNTIIAALETLPQTQHRLEVKKQGKVTIIDNAYNSNFTGFSSSLETLKLLKPKNGRTILVTPGMVELGKLHNEQHFEIGKKAGEIADITIVVASHRIKSFIEGFYTTSKSTQKLIEMPTFEKAREWLNLNTKAEDVILFENDLPDLFESRVSI